MQPVHESYSVSTTGTIVKTSTYIVDGKTYKVTITVEPFDVSIST